MDVSGANAAVAFSDFSLFGAIWPARAGAAPASDPIDEESTGKARSVGLFDQIIALVHSTEMSQRRIAIQEWEDCLGEMCDTRLAAARLEWEERFRQRAIELRENLDQTIKEYAAAVRKEYFPQTSALEMQLMMCEEEEQCQSLASDLASVQTEIEAKIAQRREELNEEVMAALLDFRREAEASLAELEIALATDMERSLTELRINQNQDFS